MQSAFIGHFQNTGEYPGSKRIIRRIIALQPLAVEKLAQAWSPVPA